MPGLLATIFGEPATDSAVPAEVWQQVVDSLPPRSKEVVLLRFWGCLTIKEVGRQLLRADGKGRGVSYGRAQQLVAKSLWQLRHPSRSLKLRPYLEKTQDDNA